VTIVRADITAVLAERMARLPCKRGPGTTILLERHACKADPEMDGATKLNVHRNDHRLILPRTKHPWRLRQDDRFEAPHATTGRSGFYILVVLK
jgi:hypothetical protein